MKRILIPAALCLAACFRDDGVVGPDTTPEPLAVFSGPGVDINLSDTSSDFGRAVAQRALKLENPKVALIWQFVGPQEYVATPSTGVTGATPPFDFTMTIQDPPPEIVQDNVDMALGQIWLYADRNRNGVLDRLVHPEMVPINARIVDTLYAAYQDLLRELTASAETREEPVVVKETYCVGPGGLVTMRNEDGADTLYIPQPGDDPTYGPLAVTAGRFRVLAAQNKFERFFALRKRNNDYYNTTRPEPGCAYAIDMSYKRKIFPRPGGERAFEALTRELILVYRRFVLESSDLVQKHRPKANYPYDGFFEDGQDYVLARSSAHFVLFIKDSRTMATLLAAERTSSFNVRNLTRLKIGYNLLTCDADYRCEVLAPGSPIRLNLGMSAEYFNPPSQKVALPVPVATALAPEPAPLAVGEEFLRRFEGGYDYLPSQPLFVVSRGGSLWASHPEEGLMRLSPADSLNFLTPLRDLQLQFVPDDSGRMQKVFAVRPGKRFVGARDTTLRAEDLEDRIDAILAPAAAALSPSRAAAIAGMRFDYAGDTLQVSQSGDSLKLRLPGMFPQAIEALDTASFASRRLELRLDFAADAAGLCPGVFVERSGRRLFAPAMGYAYPGPRDLFPALPDSLADTASAEGGSGEDSDPTPDGRPRFAYAGDSLFLRGGDGWVDTLAGSRDGGIALGKGGDFLRLRIPPMPGKTAVSVTLLLVPERASGKRRIRLETRGGAARDRQDDDLGGQAWVAVNNAPVPVTLGPFPARGEAYYVRIGQVGTADAPVAYAFGGYLAKTD